MRFRFLPVFFVSAALAGCLGDEFGSSGSFGLGNAMEQSLYSAAMSAEASGDWRTMSSHLRTLHEKHPKDRMIAVRLSRALRLGGEPRQAADFIESFVERFGKGGDTSLELGKCYLATDQINLALRNLDDARSKTPNNWETHSLSGVALDYLGRYDEAFKNYEQALKVSPDNPTVLNNFALSQAVRGDLAAAIATLEKANDQPRAHPQIRQNLALLMAIKGDATAAERFSRKDLSPEMVRHNLRYFRALAESAKVY
jgi:Flp pilus assembly protein TadD